jgi:hypothetical protein
LFYTIYKITNIINGKFYIGKHQTINLDDGYMGSGKLVRRAIQKYGKENFLKEILFIYDNEKDMNEKEKELVIISEQTYNLCDGGKGGFGYINRTCGSQGERLNKALSNEKRALGRNTQKRLGVGLYNPNLIRYYDPEQSKRALVKANSDDAKRKRKDTFRKIKHAQGKNNSQYGSFWITDGKLSKKCRGIIPNGWYKGRII